jgi:hypothetical protein
MHTFPKGTIDDFRRLERICLEQAELCRLEDARAAYRSLAANYRMAACKIEQEIEAAVMAAKAGALSPVAGA